MKQDNGEQRLSKWTQQLHDKLAEHQTEAPADLWADIEASLPPQQPRKSRFVALRRWAAAAAVAAILGTGGLVWWRQEQKSSESLISMAEEAVEAPAAPVASVSPVSPVAPEVPEVPAASVSKVAPVASEVPVAPVSPVAPEVPEVPVATEVSKSTETTEAPETTEASEPHTPKKSSSLPPPHKSERSRLPHPTISLYAMNGLGTKDNSNAVLMADALAEKYANTLANSQSSRRMAPIFLTGYEERAHHNQPLSFGLTVSYPFNQQLSLTSGLVYTNLRSEFTQIILSQQISKDQTLHYVGIPLSLTYRLWQHKGFSAYVSAGAQADWNVHAKMKAEGVEQEMGRDRMQWSANGSLGLQYDILPQMAIYAEPGINHYFDNGSQIQNFFKDKPTSLKLQMGIRLNLRK